jgi:putative ABC transport system ATP-binding protein
MDDARSAAVEPCGNDREEPSGRVTVMSAIGGRGYRWPWREDRPVADARFEYRDVRVDGDDGPIVEGFSALVLQVGLTAMVGPSGAGKSTLLRLLNRLDDPDDGEVLLDGKDVHDYDVLELRRRVQHVGQVPVTFPGTVAENLAMADPSQDAAALLQRVGLSPALVDRQADVLSVGEAQRLSLARALACGPEALLLDEPTSALDTASKGGIEQLIRSLADDGLTVVLVTHDPRQAAELADAVIEVVART